MRQFDPADFSLLIIDEAHHAGAGKPVDVIEELEEAERRKAQEAARRSQLRVHAKYSTAKINPFDVLHIEPWRERAWGIPERLRGSIT